MHQSHWSDAFESLDTDHDGMLSEAGRGGRTAAHLGWRAGDGGWEEHACGAYEAHRWSQQKERLVLMVWTSKTGALPGKQVRCTQCILLKTV